MADHLPTSAPPKICLCVLMNHPFPANLPLLRRLYSGRFTHLRFLIPFERLPDEDVITVYRGSYCHAGYLADAARDLAELECDYYLVVHDDVLLTPRLSEATFPNLFRLDAEDGFIGRVAPVPAEIGRWIWYLSFVPKLLFPKSLLFGSGVERANLSKFLPSPEELLTAMEKCGVTPSTHVGLDPHKLEDVARVPSRVLLHGLAEAIADSPVQEAVDATSLKAISNLIDAMRQAVATTGAEPGALQLPLPILHAGYLTDFYILPKSGFADFCHYIGVASAAGLFVEIIAPTLLYACCRRVLTAGDRGLDFSGFDEGKSLDWFANANAIALHPFKLSAYRDPHRQEGLLRLLGDIAQGREPDDAAWNAAGLAPSIQSEFGIGWHPPEPWGRWSGALNAQLSIRPPRGGKVRVRLRAPVHPRTGPLRGTMRIGGQREEQFAVSWPQSEALLALENLPVDDDGWTRLEIVSDRLIAPRDLDPTSPDDRQLGFGLIGVEAVGALDMGR